MANTPVAHIKITRDVNGTTIYMKSETLHALFKKFAAGRTTTPLRNSDKRVWCFGGSYPEMLGNYSGEIFNTLVSTELNEGVTLKMEMPTTKRWAEDLALKLKRDIQFTISEYCTVQNIDVVFTTSSDIIQFNVEGPTTNRSF